MLRKLTLRTFKSVYAANLEFGRVNLFIGPNGAGKSNILEALAVLASALSRGIDPVTLDSRGVRLSLPSVFKSAFKGQTLPKTFRIEAQFDHGKYECSVRSGVKSAFLEFFTEALYDKKGQVFGRGIHGSKSYRMASNLSAIDLHEIESNRSLWDLLSPITKISDEFSDELNAFSRYAIYNPQTAVMRGLAIDSRVIEPLGLTGSRLALAFSEVFQARSENNPAYRRRVDEILNVIWRPGWADQLRFGPFDVEIVPPQVHSEGVLLYIRDKFMRAKRNYLSAYDASEGTLYLIFIATLLAHERAPKTFALDNVDGTLNPELVRQLTDHIVKVCSPPGGKGQVRDSDRHQVFMTSHHPSSLDSFDIFNDEHRIFTVNRAIQGTVPGATVFRRLEPPKDTSKDDWILSHGGKNLSELLLEGRIPGALG